MMGDDRLARALELYERAVFYGDDAAVETATGILDDIEADVALARGRLLHARFLRDRAPDETERDLFERAAGRYAESGDIRGEAEALFWLGLYHQVVRSDTGAALPALTRSEPLARRSGDALLVSYVVRHLGFADMAAGRWDDARARLEESVRLRREVGHRPGVAAGLIALAGLAATEGRTGEVPVLLDEATAIARDCGAAGVLAWIDDFRAGQ
jgi:hypothetical protein